MFVQCSADRHALQNCPWYLLPLPCPQHMHTTVQQRGCQRTTSKWSLPPLLPFWVPASWSGPLCGGVPLRGLPRSSLGQTCSKHRGLHLQHGSSDKSHIVQSHTQKSIINCTPGISHQQKDSLDNLTILSLMLWFFRTVQGKKFLLGWKDGRHREKNKKTSFQIIGLCIFTPTLKIGSSFTENYYRACHKWNPNYPFQLPFAW